MGLFGKSKKQKAKEAEEKKEAERKAAEKAAQALKDEEAAKKQAEADELAKSRSPPPISAAEQERIWDEAEKAEQERLKEAEIKRSEAKAQASAAAVEETRKRADTHVADLISEGIITDFYEFQNSAGTFSSKRNDAIVLGSGAFGRVLKGRHLETHESVAIKEVSKNKMDDDNKKVLLKEVQTLKLCEGNNHVLMLKAFYQCDDYYDIVTEVAEGGELHDVIVNRTDQLEEVIAKHIAHSLLDAIAHLQDRNIAHRDVKPENILLRDRGELNGNILLCDFGFASKCNGKSLRKNCGSSAYMAPEVIKGDYYDFRCDVWSVGVTIYQMITGNKLFYGSEESIERAVTRCPGFSAEDTGSKILLKKMHPTLLNMSTYAQELLCLCLDPIQERRPLAKDLLNHAWFHSFKKRPSIRLVIAPPNTIENETAVPSILTTTDELGNISEISDDVNEIENEATPNENNLTDFPEPIRPFKKTPLMSYGSLIEDHKKNENNNSSSINKVRMNSEIIEIAPTIKTMDSEFDRRLKQAEEYQNPQKLPPNKQPPAAPLVDRRPSGKWFPSLFNFRNTCM